MEVEKTKLMNDLIDIYGSLLTDNQLNIMQFYYMDDLSLSEISENLSISRSAVHDTIKKASILLEEYEAKLHILEKENNKNKLLENFDKLNKDEIKKILESL